MVKVHSQTSMGPPSFRPGFDGGLAVEDPEGDHVIPLHAPLDEGVCLAEGGDVVGFHHQDVAPGGVLGHGACQQDGPCGHLLGDVLVVGGQGIPGRRPVAAFQEEALNR